MTGHRLAIVAACVLGALAAPIGHAADVTVQARTPEGAAAGDTVVVFEPLDAPAPAGHATAVIDQVNKRFVPHVTVIRVGTAVTFPNSDHIRHQVYSLSPAKVFTLKLYAGSPKMDVVFDQPGLVALGCNIHDTMVAFVLVVDTPFFAKTADGGSAMLALPEGRYRMRAWHEKMRAPPPPRELTVGAAPLAVPLTVDLDPATELVAPWP